MAYDGLTKQELEIINLEHKFRQRVSKLPNLPPTKFLSLQEFRDATKRDEVVVDKCRTLNYPLNDSRTEPERRELYIVQEEMMMRRFLEEPMSEWNEE